MTFALGSFVICSLPSHVGRGDTRKSSLRTDPGTLRRWPPVRAEIYLMFNLQSDDGDVACVAISGLVRQEDIVRAGDPLESVY